jgi:hypothetical protein
MTKSDQVIKYIRDAGIAGRSFTEIQRFIVETLNGKNFDERSTSVYGLAAGETPRRRYRGYWCNRLLGGMYYGPGLLKTEGCTKNAIGRWIVA